MTPIEIPEPPDIRACASCSEPISWLWSANREAWVAFVPERCGAPRAIRWHACPPPLQEAKTWRETPHGDPPSSEYIEWKTKSASTKGSEGQP